VTAHFVTPPPTEPSETDIDSAIIATATTKSGVMWVSVPGGEPARPAWHVWSEGSAVLVIGGEEQSVPGLAAASDRGTPVTVIVRSKDNHGRVVSWTATPSRLAPESEEWCRAVATLGPVRLNARDPAQQRERWASLCDVVRLTPTGDVLEAPGRLVPASHAAVPPLSPATTLRRRRPRTPTRFG
jgi:hypothetical protein